MALLVLKKEINLLTGSKIIEDYPLLIDFIRNTPTLSDKELPTLSKDAQLFFTDIYPKVIKEATNEWVVDQNSVDYVEGNKFSCELCGKRPINNICIIENRFTKKRLKIGTDCAEYYEIGKELNFKKLTAEKKRIKILERFNSIFPGIERILANWDNVVDKQDIYIKKDIKNQYIDYGVRAKEILSIFCMDNTTNKKRKDLINEMKDLLDKSNIEKLSIEKYVDGLKDNPFAPKKILLQGMTETNRINAIEMIEEDGLIKARTLWRIRDKDFSNSLIEIINSGLEIINCIIEGVNIHRETIGYVIIYNNKNRYKLFCTYSEFSSCFYQLITGEEYGDELNVDTLLNKSEIVDERCLVNASYDLIKMIKNSNLRIYESKYTDYSYNELIIKDECSKLYYIFNMKELVNSFKLQLLTGKKNYGNEVYDYISQRLKKPYPKADVDFFLENRK